MLRVMIIKIVLVIIIIGNYISNGISIGNGRADDNDIPLKGS